MLANGGLLREEREDSGDTNISPLSLTSISNNTLVLQDENTDRAPLVRRKILIKGHSYLKAVFH